MSAAAENDLDALRREYSALVPIHALHFPSHLPWYEIHNFLLNSILLDPHLQTYSPSNHYQRAFWKWTIERLERMIFNEVRH
jgi:protein-lysine N-methyltransferase EEF2KMT